MKPAVFSSSLIQQITNFGNSGFVLIRKSPTVSISLVDSINCEVLSHLEDLENSFQYRFWRFCNSVSTPLKRHSIPLPLTAGVRQLLNTNISHVFPFLESQLSLESPLVELSSIISQSGSSNQETHSDVPISSPLIISAFIALTHVTLENGPTCMYRGSHTKAFHHIKAEPVANMQKFYSVDGYDEEIMEYENNLKDININTGGIQSEGGDTEEEMMAEYPPYCAILEPGDMLLFDTKIAHHGLANTSLLPRSLLCFAFQQPDSPLHASSAVDIGAGVGAGPDSSTSTSETHLKRNSTVSGVDIDTTVMSTSTAAGSRCASKVEGFTYHCHSTMTREHITLRDYS